MNVAILVLDLKPGDKVLVPISCDSEADTPGLDPENAACRVTPRTKAMVIVHFMLV